MGQLQWRLWLIGAATFLLGNASGTASPSHSLLHFRHAVLLEGRPQFVEVTYLDSQPIQRYDSSTERMRPLTPWMNQTLTEDYWEKESDIVNWRLQIGFLKKLQKLTLPQKHHNQSTDYSEESYMDPWDEDSLEEFQNSIVSLKHHNQSMDYSEESYTDPWDEDSLEEFQNSIVPLKHHNQSMSEKTKQHYESLPR